MSDETRSKINPEKFGFTERRARSRRDRPGVIEFDDLGNAQYAWRDERMMEEGEAGESRRQRALSVANLVLVDDEPPAEGRKVALNKSGVRIGYNPYDSGLLQKNSYKKRRDLRALSKWIESRNRPANDADE